jgi:hypothetical protein
LWAFVAGSVVLNAAPLLQHPTPVATYIMNCRWPEIPSGSEVGDFPFYARSQTTGGEPTVVPFAVLERVPSASPFVVYPWFRSSAAAEPIELRERLLAPPWSGRRPDIVPDLALVSPDRIRSLAPEPRLGVLGRSLWSRTPNPIPGVYDEALRDQVIRAQQLRRVPLAVDLADKLVRLAPTGEADALMLESLRMAGLRPRAQAYLRSIPRARRSHPKINIVIALFERDAGNPSGARAMLSPVASSLRGTPAQLALTQPPSAWPEDLHSMTTVRRRDAVVEGPTGQ